jgi:hypothetical protein
MLCASSRDKQTNSTSLRGDEHRVNPLAGAAV